jgi:ABC-type glycerol-3-phosphate transport system permease component
MIANPFGIFLMRQFVLGLPKSIEESAVIDGCSHYGIFLKIVLPMTRPGQVVVFTVHSMWSWTSLIWPLIMARDESMFTLTLGLSTLSAFTKTDYGALAAGLIVSLLPPFLFFVLSQRGFIEGITMGALKE